MRNGERKQEISYTGFEIVGGDSRYNRTLPILYCMTRFIFHPSSSPYSP